LQVLIVIVVLLAIMWVLVVRPQKRRQLQQAQLLSNLEEGDEVLTAGGIYGVVRSVEEDALLVEVAPGTSVRVARRAIAGKVDPEPEAAADEPDAADDGDLRDHEAAEETASAEPNRR
jgi:preprotein translocase subunit YajC